MRGIKPIGTPVKHFGHGKGVIIGYNGQPPVDLDQQLEQIQAIKEDNPDASGILDGVFVGGMMNAVYNGDRFPYVVKFEPRKEYPEGYQDVYCNDDLEFIDND